MNDRVVIVGAGQAGLQVAVSLRQGGHRGDIVMLGAEAHLPYQRPPLSKQLLKGEWTQDKCLLRHAAWFAEDAVEFHSGQRAAGLDPANARVLLEPGGHIAYDHLAICTGSRPNRLRLPGAELAGVHYLRTLGQALALREALRPGARLLIAGGGYIGLEVAATARALGCEVDVVEPQDRLMKRSALPQLAEFLGQRHAEQGVRLHLGCALAALEGEGRVQAALLDDGRRVAADLVLVGVGVQPELRWLEGSGLDTGRGLRVDAHCRSSVSNVWGAGDVCESRHPLLAQPMVLESVQNAVSQGRVVAAGILGRDEHYHEAPWFWSEQYDCRLQMAGIPRAGDELVLRHADPHSISVLSVGANGLNAIQCVNTPKDYMAARKLIERGCNDAALREPATNLKDLL